MKKKREVSILVVALGVFVSLVALANCLLMTWRP